MQVSINTVEDLRKAWEEGKRAKGTKGNVERALAIGRLYYVEKLSMKKIGERYGLTKQRVHQILNTYY